MSKMAKKKNNDVLNADESIHGGFKPLTDEIVAGYTDKGSFERGLSYFRNNYIVEAVLRGPVLRGRCMGQSGGPYKVEVILVPVGERGIEVLRTYDCTCPRGGFCKHVVALLLTWIHRPDEVEARSDVVTLLQDKSREELLAVILGMLKHNPDLDGAVERALLAASPKVSTPGAANKLTINPTKIMKQAMSAFAGGYDYEWGESGADTSGLEELVETGDSYVEAGQWANAQAVYSAVAEAVIAHYDEIDDESGDVSKIIADCKEGLADCLEAQARLSAPDRLSPEVRLSLLKSLYDIWDHESDYGAYYESDREYRGRDYDEDEDEDEEDYEEDDEYDGDEQDDDSYDTDIPELITRAATPSERAQIKSWLETDLRPSSSAETRNRPYGPPGRLIEFLIKLKQEDGLTAEEALDEYRKAGMYREVAIRLLQRGQISEALSEYHNAGLYKEMAELLIHQNRVPEAIAIARKRLTPPQYVVPQHTLWFAELLLSKGDEWHPEALKFIEDCLWEARDKYSSEQYLKWLEEKYFRYGKANEALEVAQKRFQSEPDNRTYFSVKEAATIPGQPDGKWAEIRPTLIATLEKKGDWDDLANIFLKENAVSDALDALDRLEAARPKTRGSYYGYGYASEANYVTRSVDLERRVAQAAEKSYPDRARIIYERIAGEHIQARGRGNYQEAVKYLSKVRELYYSENRRAKWEVYIADLRASNKSLRALKEELDLGGLN
jgi:uncharacterized Zn finger protein